MTQANGGATPLVTVITPAYNVARYIGEAVDSVLRQSFRDFEYLVIDDGSSDDTVQVVRARAAGDPRLRLIPVAHSGVSAARNVGIREARGRYIGLLDGDDRWRPRFLERQVSLIQSLPPDVGMVFCRTRSMLENGLPVKLHWQRAGRYDFDDFVIRNNPARSGSSMLIRARCFAEVGGFDERLPFAEDLDMWLRIAERSASPVLWGSKHFLVDWRLRPGQATQDTSTAEPILDELLATQAAKLRRHLAAEAYIRPALLAFRHGSDAKRAQDWAEVARSAGFARLARSPVGWQLLAWHAMPSGGRRTVRRTAELARTAVKRVVVGCLGQGGSARNPARVRSALTADPSRVPCRVGEPGPSVPRGDAESPDAW